MTEIRSKYKARPVEIDGYRFDSQAEARRYGELRLMQEAGEITGLVVHPHFVLQDAFYKDGNHIRPIIYEADFQYIPIEGGIVVEEVKGFETPVWKIKQRMFWKRYPEIELKVIK